MISFAVVAPILAILPTSLLAQTLSLQGNMVHKPLKSTFAPRGIPLKSCASFCFHQKKCQLFVYNKVNSTCELATKITDPPSRSLKKDEVAYLRGKACAKARSMHLRTSKPGRFWDEKHGHRFVMSYDPPLRGSKVEEPGFCHANNLIDGCNFTSYGSTDNGFTLTKDRSLPGYVHYGFCTLTQGACRAARKVMEYYMGGTDYIYYDISFNTYYGNGKFFCYFWNPDANQCTKGQNSKPFVYSFNEKLVN